MSEDKIFCRQRGILGPTCSHCGADEDNDYKHHRYCLAGLLRLHENKLIDKVITAWKRGRYDRAHDNLPRSQHESPALQACYQQGWDFEESVKDNLELRLEREAATPEPRPPTHVYSI